MVFRTVFRGGGGVTDRACAVEGFPPSSPRPSHRRSLPKPRPVPLTGPSEDWGRLVAGAANLPRFRPLGGGLWAQDGCPTLPHFSPVAWPLRISGKRGKRGRYAWRPPSDRCFSDRSFGGGEMRDEKDVGIVVGKGGAAPPLCALVDLRGCTAVPRSQVSEHYINALYVLLKEKLFNHVRTSVHWELLLSLAQKSGVYSKKRDTHVRRMV